MADDTLAKLFWSRVERSGDRPAQQFKQGGAWQTRTWREVGEVAREIALGLIALGRQKGETVALLSASRSEWVQADFAIFSAGCITVPVYPSYPPDLVAYVIKDSGARTVFVEDAGQLAKVLEARDRIPQLEQIVVMSGYDAPQPPKSVMTWQTLRRLGRDNTATIVGKAVAAEEVEIWKDVDGVLTADPRIVPHARPVERISYAEASELAYYGAKVIHPSTIHPALESGIPVRILNTFRPKAPGTVILPTRPKDAPPVTSIASKRGIRLVNINSARMLGQSGFMASVFESFRRHDVVIDLIATSEVSVTVSVDRPEGLDAAVADIGAVAEVTVEGPCALVAVVGEGIGETIGVAGKVFSALERARVNVRAISYGATKTNLQVVVAEDDANRSVAALHAAIFE